MSYYSCSGPKCLICSAELFVVRSLTITNLDPEGFRVEAKARGEKFSLSKHVQGTEIKAITYSNLQVHQKDGRVDIYVIVDI